jgi:hypothetical protein
MAVSKQPQRIITVQTLQDTEKQIAINELKSAAERLRWLSRNVMDRDVKKKALLKDASVYLDAVILRLNDPLMTSL